VHGRPSGPERGRTSEYSSGRAEADLLGSGRTFLNQRGRYEHPEFQQLATVYASSCHPMLAFAGMSRMRASMLLRHDYQRYDELRVWISAVTFLEPIPPAICCPT
jgi:hypothetical protein